MYDHLWENIGKDFRFKRKSNLMLNNKYNDNKYDNNNK